MPVSHVETSLERNPNSAAQRHAHTWWRATSPEFVDERGVRIEGWGNSRLDAVSHLMARLPEGTQHDAQIDKLEAIKEYAELQQQSEVLASALRHNTRVFKLVAEDDAEGYRGVSFNFPAADSVHIITEVKRAIDRRLKEVEAILGIAGF